VAVPGPYSWEPHIGAWAATVAGAGLVVVAHRRLQYASGERAAWGHRRMGCFAVACVGLVLALTWPVADLAAHWSLTMLVVQRLLLLLLVAPMLWLGLPDDVLRRLTRPPIVDTLLGVVQRPPVAVAVVTAASVGSMTPALVRAQATSVVARGCIDVAILLAGLVLWVPVIGRLPGTPRPKPVVRFGYLVFQAVVPAFLSFIYIFSRHPLYDTFSGSWTALGIRPLTDQQVAGFVSKLTMLFVLLTVGSVVLSRASRADDELLDEPLVWADVERAFERVDRRRRGHPVGPDGPVLESPDGESDADSGTRPDPRADPGPGSEGNGSRSGHDDRGKAEGAGGAGP